MNQSEKDRELYEQAEALALQLERLTLQANTVRNQLVQLNNQRTRREADKDKVAPVPRRNQTIQIGDKVVVTNKYKGRQGTIGIVTRLTRTQAYVDPEGDGEVFRRYKANLRKL